MRDCSRYRIFYLFLDFREQNEEVINIAIRKTSFYKKYTSESFTLGKKNRIIIKYNNIHFIEIKHVR